MNIDFRENIFFLLFIIYNIYVLFISIYNAIITSKDKYSPHEVAKMNLTIKAWQIPAYIINFILGILAFLSGPLRLGDNNINVHNRFFDNNFNRN